MGHTNTGISSRYCLRSVGRIQQAAVLSLVTSARHSGFRKDSRSLAQSFCNSAVGNPGKKVHTLKSGAQFRPLGASAAENLYLM